MKEDEVYKRLVYSARLLKAVYKATIKSMGYFLGDRGVATSYRKNSCLLSHREMRSEQKHAVCPGSVN